MPASSPLSLFYDNRRLLVMAIGLIVVGGLSSFFVLPRMEDPLLTQRAGIINTLYPGASPERVEALVTEKLEEELQEIEEIKEMRSSSRSGISTITIELKDNVYAVDDVWSRIRDKISDAEPFLPAQASEPNFDKLEVTAFASIVGLVWDLPTEPNYAILRRKAEVLEDLLRGIPGTRDVETFGEPREEILVEVRQHDLGSLGLSVASITQALRASDAKVSAGQMRSQQDNYIIEVATEFDTLERIRRLPITTGADGRFVPLGDIAEVTKGVARPLSSLALVENKPAIVLGSLVSSQQRVDLWTADLQTELATFAEQLPTGVRLKVLFEQNQYVATRLATLLGNLLARSPGRGGGRLVHDGLAECHRRRGGTRRWRRSWCSAACGCSGIPMHQMSITGLIIALGLLIDNAIVMVDEVRTRIAAGTSRGEAVAQSVRHLAVPLFGSTVTTALSFAPIALMPGPAGEFVGSIALSVILAVCSSLVLALTVTPLADRHPGQTPRDHGPPALVDQRVFQPGPHESLSGIARADFPTPRPGDLDRPRASDCGFPLRRHAQRAVLPPCRSRPVSNPTDHALAVVPGLDPNGSPRPPANGCWPDRKLTMSIGSLARVPLRSTTTCSPIAREPRNMPRPWSRPHRPRGSPSSSNRCKRSWTRPFPRPGFWCGNWNRAHRLMCRSSCGSTARTWKSCANWETKSAGFWPRPPR